VQAFPTLAASRNRHDTLLTGSLPDQSALYGVIHQLEALGLELLEIRSWPSAALGTAQANKLVVQAVIFDLDGVLLDSEQLWNQSKEAFVRATGGRWRDDAPRAMLGMNSTEWSSYMHDELGVPLPREEINRGVVARMEDRYRSGLPLLPGAVDAVRGLAAHWPVALASSANREIIDLVLELSGLAETFAVTVSSDEVPRGKPAPDVYVEAARRLGVSPANCMAVEDSSSGLRSAAAAGLTAIAVPNPHYPPGADALALAAATITTLHALTPRLVISAAARSRGGE
jgi:HAD superfamily hydrolase (TIGR01509 family)